MGRYLNDRNFRYRYSNALVKAVEARRHVTPIDRERIERAVVLALRLRRLNKRIIDDGGLSEWEWKHHSELGPAIDKLLAEELGLEPTTKTPDLRDYWASGRARSAAQVQPPIVHRKSTKAAAAPSAAQQEGV